jgi:hypothetical protein
MNKKLISSLLILLLLNLFGCYSYQTISTEELNRAEENKDLQVITKNKHTYEFEEGNYAFNSDSIYGSGKLRLKNDKKVNEDYEGSIYFQDIEKLKMKGFDVTTTILAVAIPLVLIIIAAANFSIMEE